MNLIEKLAEDLKLGDSYIASIVNRTDFYYRDYTIPKKKWWATKYCSAESGTKNSAILGFDEYFAKVTCF